MLVKGAPVVQSALSELVCTQSTCWREERGTGTQDPFDAVRPEQNGRHFTDSIIECIMLREKKYSVSYFTEVCSRESKLQ